MKSKAMSAIMLTVFLTSLLMIACSARTYAVSPESTSEVIGLDAKWYGCALEVDKDGNDPYLYNFETSVDGHGYSIWAGQDLDYLLCVGCRYYRGFAQWDTSSIPDGVYIQSVNLTINLPVTIDRPNPGDYVDVYSSNMEIRQMTLRPSDYGRGNPNDYNGLDLFNDVYQDKQYALKSVDQGDGWRTIDLGSFAAQDLENQLAVDWFAVGFKEYTEKDDGTGEDRGVSFFGGSNCYLTVTYVDISPPTTTDNYDGLWHNTDFTITLTATDDLSGVAETYYEINYGPTKTVSADGQPYITTESDNNKLEYWSTDNAANEESHHLLTNIKLDKTQPTTTDNYDGVWHTIDFSITLTSTDGLSGVDEILYKVNDSPTKSVSMDGQPLIATENANNTLEYWSIDNAGNEELPHKALTGIKLDKTAPTIETPTRQPTGDVEQDQLVKVSVDVTDATSGVKNIILSYTTNNGSSWTDLPMTPNSTSGLYETTIPGQSYCTWVKYKITAYDNADNMAVEDKAGEYYPYHVIPELPKLTSMLLVLIMLTVAIVIFKRRPLKKPIH